MRSDSELPRAKEAAQAAGLDSIVLDERIEMRQGRVPITTMHRAKGLEFRAVVVMACDDEIIPLQSRIETVGSKPEKVSRLSDPACLIASLFLSG